MWMLTVRDCCGISMLLDLLFCSVDDELENGSRVKGDGLLEMRKNRVIALDGR